MHSDEDMLGLLLTEAKGLRRGEVRESAFHAEEQEFDETRSLGYHVD